MTLNILSIDVGMKNLAICLFSLTDNVDYRIKCWDVLNLCEEENFICGEKNNKCKPCNKSAKFFKNDKYYCKIHAKKKEYKKKQQRTPTKKKSFKKMLKKMSPKLIKTPKKMKKGGGADFDTSGSRIKPYGKTAKVKIEKLKPNNFIPFFKPPETVKFAKISSKTGRKLSKDQKNSINESFKLDTNIDSYNSNQILREY